MFSNVLYFVFGLALLLVGGRLLVSASVSTAWRLKVAPLVVGLTLVAWGTSAPELALNCISAFKGRSDLALGNIIGANICNMGLVLGLCGLIRPLVVQERLIKVEIWINAAILLLMTVLGALLGLPSWSAGIMLAIFAAYSTWTILSSVRASRTAAAARKGEMVSATFEGPKNPMSWGTIVWCFVGGLMLLSVGGSFASDAASAIAIGLGVPSTIVGVTIVSIGTTLPELVTGVVAVRHGQTDLAMGNAIGSCLFNAGAIFGLIGLISPFTVSPELFIPLITMGLLAVALVPISRTFNRTVSRIESAMLLGIYLTFLVMSARSA